MPLDAAITRRTAHKQCLPQTKQPRELAKCKPSKQKLLTLTPKKNWFFLYEVNGEEQFDRLPNATVTEAAAKAEEIAAAHPGAKVETFEFGQPVVGNGATLAYPTDRYPYLITAVTAHTLTVRRVNQDGAKLKPADNCNGFPVFDHTFTRKELKEHAVGPQLKAYKRKDGRYYLDGQVIFPGVACYYRNYAD